MTDSQLLSIHLEGLPRREEFRQARERLKSACGEYTLMGDLRDLPPEPMPESPTYLHLDGEARPPSSVSCFLQDGSSYHPLHIGMNSVGRLPDNDVVVPHPSVSRRHCAIVIHSDMRVELHDIASKNGTLLNGRRISGPTPLQHGDTISLCDRHLHFCFSSAGAPAKQKSHSSLDQTQAD